MKPWIHSIPSIEKEGSEGGRKEGEGTERKKRERERREGREEGKKWI